MIFLALVSTILVTVLGQARDPTKVCMPDVFQIQSYSVKHKIGSILAFDFNKQLTASRMEYGHREVIDYAGKTIAHINETDGTCMKHVHPASSFFVDPQCLPANMTLWTDGPKFFGLNPGGLEIQAWQFLGNDEFIYRIALTKSSPAIPVIMHTITPSYDGTKSSNVQIMFNGKTSIDDPTMFTIPPVCPSLELSVVSPKQQGLDD